MRHKECAIVEPAGHPVGSAARVPSAVAGRTVRSGNSGYVVLCLLGLAACRINPQATDLQQDAFEKIDVHTHYFAPRSYLVPMLARWHARSVILNYTLGQPDSLVRRRWADVRALADAAPDRFWLATPFDPTAIDQPDFASRTLAQLRTDFAGGAVMLKVWKDLGLMVRDRSGRFVQIDDPRLQPIWDFLSARHIPVLEHSADPREGWRVLDPTSPNYQYFRANPDHYPYLHPEVPRWETVIAAPRPSSVRARRRGSDAGGANPAGLSVLFPSNTGARLHRTGGRRATPDTKRRVWHGH